MPHARRQTLRARYLFPVDAPVVAGGSVTIERDRIVAVGKGGGDAPTLDLGNVAILPGLVNAHTHLEFSDFERPLGSPGIHFSDWLRLVIDFRRQSTERNVPQSAALGLAESFRAGVAALGEIATSGWSPSVFNQSPIEATVFGEVLNLREELVEEKLQQAEAHLTTCAESADGWTAGISPHAPYTLHQEMFVRLVDLAVRRGASVAMHLAESPEELELLRQATGPIRQLLDELGVWNDRAIPRGSRPLDYLRQLARCQRSLVVHGNYLDAAEIAFAGMNAETMSVVYCPRTHAYFGHEPYPLVALLSVGANVALGTDSRASNPDLELFEEIRFAARRHPIAPAAALELGTLAGARALGIDGDFGSIRAGKRACLTIVQLPEHDAADPHELLLDESAMVQSLLINSAFGH
jgi:cytosine/adenosine deaminase-related metal-dependent hydrolase